MATDHANGVSGRNGLPPPAETRWSTGQPSPNPGGQPKHKKFRAMLRAHLENPETRKLIFEKIDRDLKGDGAAAFALKCIAYVYGEPKHTIELITRERAEELASAAGVTIEALMARAEQLTEHLDESGSN